MKIKLRNFQAAREEEVVVNPGFTLITGPTNNGKTSVFRALTSLLLNPSKAVGYINGNAIKEKGDAAELSVTIEDNDIPKIEFHRTKSKAWYVVDGKKYSKLERSNIFDIYPELHKKFVYIPEDPRKILNFQTEEHLAFPFDRSDTEMFKLFERIFNIADTRAIIDTLRKEDEEARFKLEQNELEKSKLTDINAKNLEVLSQINKELILNYMDQLYRGDQQKNLLLDKIKTIANYAPILKIMQELPELSKIDGDQLQTEILNLQNLLQSCNSKIAFIHNFEEMDFQSTDLDASAEALKLREKIQEIGTLSQKIEAQDELIVKNCESIKELETKLSEYKVCPLCGHTL